MNTADQKRRKSRYEIPIRSNGDAAAVARERARDAEAEASRAEAAPVTAPQSDRLICLGVRLLGVYKQKSISVRSPNSV